jgi:hypothetical protein
MLFAALKEKAEPLVFEDGHAVLCPRAMAGLVFVALRILQFQTGAHLSSLGMYSNPARKEGVHFRTSENSMGARALPVTSTRRIDKLHGWLCNFPAPRTGAPSPGHPGHIGIMEKSSSTPSWAITEENENKR